MCALWDYENAYRTGMKKKNKQKKNSKEKGLLKTPMKRSENAEDNTSFKYKKVYLHKYKKENLQQKSKTSWGKGRLIIYIISTQQVKNTFIQTISVYEKKWG